MKAARKKLKRQEIANRAAEKELAEISLEQQVLRELRVKQLQKTPENDVTLEASNDTATCTEVNTANLNDANLVSWYFLYFVSWFIQL